MIRSRLLNILLLSLPIGSATADTALTHFEIPAGDAAKSLQLFLATAHIEMLYQLDKIRGVQTNAVNGDFTPHDALAKMLAGTALSYTFTPDESFVTVVRLAAADR